MAQPPPPPMSPPQAPPPGPYGPPGPPGYPSPYPAPPPKKSNTALIVVIIVVVVVVVIGLVAWAMLSLLSAPFGGTQPATITFGQVTDTAGNRSIAITSVSTSTTFAMFQVSLEKDGVQSSSQPLLLSPAYATVTIGSEDFRIYWIDQNGNLLVSQGDSIRVSGDNAPLPSGNYTLRVTWLLSGADVGQKTFVVT